MKHKRKNRASRIKLLREKNIVLIPLEYYKARVIRVFPYVIYHLINPKIKDRNICGCTKV